MVYIIRSFYEYLTKYLDNKAIEELVLTNKNISILSTEVVDIGFVFFVFYLLVCIIFGMFIYYMLFKK